MNILVLTSVYPRDDAFKNTSATKVIHYFAEEWKKSGHNVFVIHTSSRLLKFTYVLPQKVKDFLKAKTGNEFPDVNITKKKQYDYEGINVFRRPVFKLVPRRLASKKEVQKCAIDIKAVLDKNSFIPDVIIGHWAVPQIQIMAELDKYYRCKKSIVLHDDYYIKHYRNELSNDLAKIDAIGCRSKTMAESVQRELGTKKRPFICYSGVPDDFVNEATFIAEKYSTPIRRFIFVGELIKRKNCDTVIKALNNSDVLDWHLDIVGQGNEKENIERLVNELDLEKRVSLYGRVPREKVFTLMSDAQCFIMPSKGEAFGLVYLEAMVASCITIGSKNEGIDGIIHDGENGFLVDAGDEECLTKKLNQIANLNTKKIRSIAKLGFDTAIHFTDSNVAQEYLSDMLNW